MKIIKTRPYTSKNIKTMYQIDADHYEEPEPLRKSLFSEVFNEDGELIKNPLKAFNPFTIK